MSTTNDTAENTVEQSDIAIDVAANDLVHIGTDTQGFEHYYDVQRDRIIVVDASHDEYVPEDSIMVRRSLVASASAVDAIVGDVDGRLGDYAIYIDDHVADRDWARFRVNLLDASAMLGGIGGA